MSEIPPELMQKFSTDAMGGHPNVTPKDASTLILLDRSGPEPKVLMGKRHDRHVFMPGAYVFPGGRVDPIDRSMEVAASLDPRAEQKLMTKIGLKCPGRRASRKNASSGPSIAPTVSSARCTPNAVASSSFGVLSEISASRGAVRIPFPVRSMRMIATRKPHAAPTTRNSGLQIAESP